MSYPYRFAPDCRILGQVGQSILNNIKKDELAHLVKKHHIDNLEPNEYYPVDNFINVFAELAQKGGSSSVFVAVGIAVINNMQMPRSLDQWTLEKKFALPVETYKNNAYKDKTPGEMSQHWIAENHISYHHDTVWPDDLIYGYIYSFARRFLGDKYSFTVFYDDNIPRQDQGGDNTIIHVTWKPK